MKKHDNMKAKPFVKWVGGKRQLIDTLEDMLPERFDEIDGITYVEPFVGDGSMLFHMLQSHGNIGRAVINDVNPDLAGCYTAVRDDPSGLIGLLRPLRDEYMSLGGEDARRGMYLRCRAGYNERSEGFRTPLERAAAFIFLNRTCYNGLCRVNRSGGFNVPFGKYRNPPICDEETIMADSGLLQRVEVRSGDFEDALPCLGGPAFIYCDPPYRPLSATSNFHEYAKEPFGDAEQERLKAFCDRAAAAGAFVMASNSDCEFFDRLYEGYRIDRVLASRNVNSDGSGRGKIKEIVIRSY